jgi:serine/threonine-protein kinase
MVAASVRLNRLLGQGGAGTVWIADHLTLHTQVAVKILFPDLVRRDPTLLERFNREANVAARLKSPHVVRIFDFGIVEQTPFIVMELLEGESLAARLERTGPLPTGDACLVVLQAARALREAHSAGIIHRDIKPDNLFLVGGAGERDRLDELFVKVLDFGMAKAADGQTDLTHTDTTFGTPRYMSPEQFMSARNVDAQADLWALAAVAYKALTGAVPFDGETLAAVAMAACRGKFTAPTELRHDLPPALDAWFNRAFDLDVTRRFGSATELASTFLTAAGRGPGEAIPVEVASVRDPEPVSPAEANTLRAIAPPARVDTLGPSPSATAATLGPVATASIFGRRRPPAMWIGLLAATGVAGALGGYFAVRQEPAPSAAGGAALPAEAPRATASTPSADSPGAARGGEPVPSSPAPSAAASSAAPASAAPGAPASASRPAHPPVAAPAPTAAPSASASPPPSCTPPYTVDATGVRRYKLECL